TTPGQNPPPPAGGTDAPLLIRSGKPGPYPSFQNPRPTLRTAPSSAEYPGTSPSGAPPPPKGGLLPGGRDGFPADVPPGEKRCFCRIQRVLTNPNPTAHVSAPAGTVLTRGNRGISYQCRRRLRFPRRRRKTWVDGTASLSAWSETLRRSF